MIFIDTQKIPSSSEIKIVNEIIERKITHVFHDIDGTHSLIREWQPVMSMVLNYVVENGLPNGYDSDENINALIAGCGK